MPARGLAREIWGKTTVDSRHGAAHAAISVRVPSAGLPWNENVSSPGRADTNVEALLSPHRDDHAAVLRVPRLDLTVLDAQRHVLTRVAE